MRTIIGLALLLGIVAMTAPLQAAETTILHVAAAVPAGSRPAPP